MNKYTYYKIIQTNSGFGWDDDDWHETDSKYRAKDKKLFNANVRAYRENSFGAFTVRLVRRRELHKEHTP